MRYKKSYKNKRIKQKNMEYVLFFILLSAAYLFNFLSKKGYDSTSIKCIIVAICVITVGIYFTVITITNKTKQNKYLNTALYDVDHMSGKDFEKYLKAHFEKLGYKVKLTPDSNDFGADLICKKDGLTTIVQAKRYKGKVGIAAVQEIVAAKGYYKADKCMVVTNAFYTSGAKQLANSNDVELWDRNSINSFFEIAT